MNGAKKWHKATGPAFYPGEEWVSATGSRVRIISVRKYPGASLESNRTSDYSVTYEWVESDGAAQQYENDAWNFQVRYQHIADEHL